jgi:hypothetical protein
VRSSTVVIWKEEYAERRARLTDEPSILVDRSFGVRVEDVIEVTTTGGKILWSRRR